MLISPGILHVDGLMKRNDRLLLQPTVLEPCLPPSQLAQQLTMRFCWPVNMLSGAFDLERVTKDRLSSVKARGAHPPE